MVPGSEFASSRDASQARETLLTLLESAYGSAEDASAALGRALLSSARTELPSTIPELIAFVRTDLLPVLSGELGPRLTMALLDDFIVQHETPSGIRGRGPVSSGPQLVGRLALRSRAFSEGRPRRVLLVDADRIGRPVLARALLRASCQVTVVDSLEELGQIARSGEDIDVAIVDAQHPARLLVLEVIVDSFPGVSLVVRSAGEAATRALLHALGAVRFEVRSRDASTEELIAAVIAVTGSDGR
ncbi:MAG TPA: hypothetical protein VIF09_10080 [Polyangiaceae bacterium]|jgi:CheY-like chemotaxis protein